MTGWSARVWAHWQRIRQICADWANVLGLMSLDPSDRLAAKRSRMPVVPEASMEGEAQSAEAHSPPPTPTLLTASSTTERLPAEPSPPCLLTAASPLTVLPPAEPPPSYPLAAPLPSGPPPAEPSPLLSSPALPLTVSPPGESPPLLSGAALTLTVLPPAEPPPSLLIAAPLLSAPPSAESSPLLPAVALLPAEPPPAEPPPSLPVAASPPSAPPPAEPPPSPPPSPSLRPLLPPMLHEHLGWDEWWYRWRSSWGRGRQAPGKQRVLGSTRFLQYYFRRSRLLRPLGCWARAGLTGLIIYRPTRTPRCCFGQNLASSSDFDKQRERAAECIRWYAQYSRIVQRLESGRAPMVIDLFCCAGGATEGVRRAGGTTIGVDHEEQPEFVARFGAEAFVLSDALDRERLRRLVRKHKPIGVIASPPCEGYTSATFAGEPSTAPKLIAEVREMLAELQLPFAIENVTGARSELASGAVELRGPFFGLETIRPRLLEPGGGLRLHVDEVLRQGGGALEAMSCLGSHARFPRLDSFGRRLSVPCCAGNTFAIQGDAPTGSSVEQCAHAMGLDPGHMRYLSMSKALPPAYISYVFGQMAMHVAHERFGVPMITYDDMLADPAGARRQMLHLLRGAGGVSPRADVSLVDARGARVGGSHRVSVASLPTADGRPAEEPCPAPPPDTPAPTLPSEESSRRPANWSLSESDFREIDYSHAGDYDQCMLERGARDWLESLRARVVLTHDDAKRADAWRGRNTFVHVRDDALRASLTSIRDALRSSSGDTRVTVAISVGDDPLLAELGAMGFRRVMSLQAAHTRVLAADGSMARMSSDLLIMAAGERECRAGAHWLEHSEVEHLMDPRDRGAPSAPPGQKAAIAWSPLRRDASGWDGIGLPPRVVKMMTEGVTIDTIDADSVNTETFETAQYAWRDANSFVHGAAECDRAIMAGHLEPVPAADVAHSLELGHVHPWTVVQQSADKWRSCQDYSSVLNRRVATSPFTLPSVWDVRKVVKPTSFFGKYDLRDGFWSVPVAAASRHHLMVRHPATGQLLRCTSLPFGYALSPLHFCDVTESVASVLRQRCVGLGVHVFVFVDDFLIVGDTQEATAEGMRRFEELLAELRLPWAPHKLRGPARVIEFLGFLLVNSPDQQCVALTASRQRRMIDLIDSWLARRPGEGATASAEPLELAQLLGHLVFISDVVPCGRTYMQAMLRQFRGLEVDWARGAVRHAHGAWRSMQLDGGFWRDLVWWRSAMRRANCTPMAVPAVGEAAVTGSDASDFACGELVWLDGAREETQLVFTRAERRRPINFRELRGCLRVLEIWGERLRGRLVLIELDNTCAFEAARQSYCKAEDMQELVRRIVDRAERFGITLRLVHTPGAMLHRPDQTSRGDAPEEPRVRFTRSAFSLIESRFGPFDSFLGAEREQTSGGGRAPQAGQAPRLWLHPSFTTVGSALRLIGEQLSTEVASCARGIVVVPFAPEAPWWRLTRHFTAVGRFEVGSQHLEIDRLGRWEPVRAQRDALLMVFPRAAGAQLRQPRDDQAALPAGSLLYEPTGQPSRSGGLLLTREASQGGGRVLCERLHYVHGRSPSIYSRRPGPRETVDVSDMWLVNHLGRESSAAGEAERQASTRRFIFDAAAAEVEIEARMSRGAVTRAAEAASAAARDELASGETADEADSELRPMSGYLERRESSARASQPRQQPADDGRGHRRLAVDGRPRMQCRYGGIRCRGCGARIAFGGPVCAGGDGLVHDDRSCLEQATAQLATRARAEQQAERQPAATLADDANDLSVGAELASFVSMETEFAMETGSGRMADCLLPRDDAETFATFLRWASEKGSERDVVSSLWRAGSTLMARTRGEDLTRRAEVQQAHAALHD